MKKPSSSDGVRFHCYKDEDISGSKLLSSTMLSHVDWDIEKLTVV
jgi:hypothetical protein